VTGGRNASAEAEFCCGRGRGGWMEGGGGREEGRGEGEREGGREGKREGRGREGGKEVREVVCCKLLNIKMYLSQTKLFYTCKDMFMISSPSMQQISVRLSSCPLNLVMQ
jgi:hypothetical protein